MGKEEDIMELGGWKPLNLNQEAFVQELQQQIREFVRERDWEQYHSPKNLAMALSVEVAEILEIFQWQTEQASATPDAHTRAHLEEEIGDVMILLTNLADRLEIDPISAAKKKLVINRSKYPAEKVCGKSFKYTAYQPSDEGNSALD